MLLLVLTQYFIIDQYKKMRKVKYWYAFIVFNVYVVLDEKLINLFKKNFAANNMEYQKFNETRIADNNKLWIGQVYLPW